MNGDYRAKIKVSIIELQVNGHPVKVTTDQEITQAWADDMVKYIQSVEGRGKHASKGRLRVIKFTEEL